MIQPSPDNYLITTITDFRKLKPRKLRAGECNLILGPKEVSLRVWHFSWVFKEEWLFPILSFLF